MNYHIKHEESESGEYPLYKGDRRVGEILFFEEAKEILSALKASFQKRVAPWMEQCFGPRISADTTERNHRFFEEATELVQSGGMSREDAHALVDYVYNRPVGEMGQEIGGVMVTLAALCLANQKDMHQEGETELLRIFKPEIMEKIRAKQLSKPRGSALPQSVQSLAQEVEYELYDHNDELVAGASGKNAIQEIMNYAQQYMEDGPVEVYEVTRKLVMQGEKK